jgi:uncharacterized protein
MRKWGVFGRVLLFLLACPVILVLTNPLASKLADPSSEVAIGLGTTIATLLLTLLFVRWEGLRLSDVGAAPTSASWGRLFLGFLIGLAMVTVQTALVCFGGHVRWVRTPGAIGLPVAISFFSYLLLASREELAFRGYPLRRLASTVGVWIAQFTVIVAFVLEHRLGGFSTKR